MSSSNKTDRTISSYQYIVKDKMKEGLVSSRVKATKTEQNMQKWQFAVVEKGSQSFSDILCPSS